MKNIVFAATILLAIIQFAMCNSNHSQISPPPNKFFSKINGDLTKIVWAHAVNSQKTLHEALASEEVMMLEADIVLGKCNNQSDIPIMAHPPASESDLSLDDFLFQVINKTVNKGIKLDFKSDDAFNKSKLILNKYRSNLTFPVFLNADIVSGPVNASTTPVNATLFLEGVDETLPEATLSIGWTTRYGKDLNITSGEYNSTQLKTMLEAVADSNIKQPVTYPVRAGLVANDTKFVKTLLENRTLSTLTIWSSEGDFVDAAQLSNLIKQVGTDKVYLDVPEKLKNQLHFSSASTIVKNLGTLLAVLVLSMML